MSSSPNGSGVLRPMTTPMPHEHKLLQTTDGPHEFRLSVDFPTRVGLGALDTVRVRLEPLQVIHPVVDTGKTLLSEPMPVRLVIPGVLVAPPEQGLEPTPFGPAVALFHINPVAIGPLPEARVELLRGGRIESIP